MSRKTTGLTLYYLFTLVALYFRLGDIGTLYL